MELIKEATYPVDLHTHTWASDGYQTWQESISHASKTGMRALAITDHINCIDFDSAIQFARSLGVVLVPGVELKYSLSKWVADDPDPAIRSEIPAELLVYGIDWKNLDYVKARDESLGQYRRYAETYIKILSQHRFSEIPGVDDDSFCDLDWEKYAKFLGDQQFFGATAMIEYVMDRLGIDKKRAKKWVISFQKDAIRESGLLETCPFYSRDILDGISQARGWGQLLSFAHPFTNTRKRFGPIYDRMMPAMVEAGLDAVEWRYPEHTELDRDHVRRWASEHGLMVTGGSDCHRLSDKEYPLGGMGLNMEEFEALGLDIK